MNIFYSIANHHISWLMYNINIDVEKKLNQGENQSMEKAVCDFLKKPVWAIVGASSNQTKYGYRIYKLLRHYGYTVFPVNPREKEIDGQSCYASLADLPIRPDVVDFVVPPPVAVVMVKECAQMEIKNVWFQPGVADGEVMRAAEALGLNYIHDTCVMVQSTKRYTMKQNLWAIVGDSDGQLASSISEYLRDKGYMVHLIIPKSGRDILNNLPFKPDVLAIASHATVTETAIRECKKRGIDYIWLQLGYESENLINLALSLQLNVVHHASIIEEYPSVKSCQ